jgi:hypothetical protein
LPNDGEPCIATPPKSQAAITMTIRVITMPILAIKAPIPAITMRRSA